MEQSLNGLKVMIIDDSKTIRRTAETLLQKEGCEVITAEDGFDALAKIADHKPQIIFVDVMMPRLDGYQTCALIKNNSEFKSTPVIMLSSKDGLFDKAKGPDTARIAASLPEIEKCCKALDAAVAKTGHLVGASLTYADMNVIPMLATLQNFPAGKEIVAKYPALAAYVTNVTGRPSYTNTAPPPRK